MYRWKQPLLLLAPRIQTTGQAGFSIVLQSR